jgi:hypothetical protein
MAKATTETLAARLDFLSVALQEIARALAPAQVAQVADALGRRVVDLAGPSLAPNADLAVTRELLPLLEALGQRPVQ